MNKIATTVLATVLAAFAAVPGSTAVASAGDVRGPQVGSTRVDAESSDFYQLVLAKGQETTILVRGDGDTDLDCYLKDQNGNLVAGDDDGTDMCIVKVTPRWTGSFRLEVRNLGNVYNRYTLHVD